MIENNRDILKHALSKMPAHNASKSVWQRVASGLTQMEMGLFMSKSISGLPRYKAPAGAWASIEKGLAGSLLTGTTGLLIKIGSFSLVGASIITAIYFLTPEKNEAEMKFPVVEEQQDTHSDESSQEGGLLPIAKVEDVTSSNTSGDALGVDPAVPNKEQSQPVIIKEVKKPVQPDESHPIISNSINTPMDRNVSSGLNFLYPVKQVYFAKINRENELLEIPNRQETKGNKTSDDYVMVKPPLDTYLGGTFSHLNYHNVSINNMDIPESVSSYGIDLMFERNRFYLKTGISYITWMDKAGYTFNYNKNELIYSYHYVDSVNIVPTTGQIKYYTTPKDVYDSIAYQQQQNTKNQYRVLQIPVVFGYKLLESKQLTIGLNAGLGADLRIGGKEYIPVFEEEQSQITSVNNQLIYRSDLNWRLIGGLGMYYRISDRFRLMLEPSYEIYLNPVYENTDQSGVFYLKFKTGLQIKL